LEPFSSPLGGAREKGRGTSTYHGPTRSTSRARLLTCSLIHWEGWHLRHRGEADGACATVTLECRWRACSWLTPSARSPQEQFQGELWKIDRMGAMAIHPTRPRRRDTGLLLSRLQRTSDLRTHPMAFSSSHTFCCVKVYSLENPGTKPYPTAGASASPHTGGGGEVRDR